MIEQILLNQPRSKRLVTLNKVVEVTVAADDCGGGSDGQRRRQ